MGYNASGGLEVVDSEAKAAIKCEAREGKVEKSGLFKPPERLGSQLTKIVSKKKNI